MSARTLILDIETSPIQADVWMLRDVTVAINQIRKPGAVIGVGLKWRGDKAAHFYSDFHDGHAEMVAKVYDILGDTDILVTFNGKSFDLPWLNTEFIAAGFPPYAPVKHVDLYRVARSRFRWPSFKLDYIVQTLGLGAKVKHEGHALWSACEAGDPKAWARMKKYCIGDVRITEALLDKLEPWQNNPPHAGLFVDSDVPRCPRCGGTSLQRRGLQHAALYSYPRLHCQSCGGWARGAKMERSVPETRAI